MFYKQLDDVIDELAISQAESTPGNIGSGYLRGLRLDTDIALWGGIKGSVAMVFQRSAVADSFVN